MCVFESKVIIYTWVHCTIVEILYKEQTKLFIYYFVKTTEKHICVPQNLRFPK